MKHTIYLTGNKVWFDGVARVWEGNGLIEIFRSYRQNIDFSEVRVVVGNQLSYLTAFPWKKEFLTREVVELETRKYLPIEVENENFDWKVMEIDDKKWIQAVAVEKNFLELLSRAVKASGMRVSSIVPIGILLGQRSIWKRDPILIKWNGMEKLSVLAVRGLVDSVYDNAPDDKITKLAKIKWGLSAYPEIVHLLDSNFNLAEEAFKEKKNRQDQEIINIPIFRNMEFSETGEAQTIEPGGNSLRPWLPVFFALGILLVAGLVWLLIIQNL